MQCVQHAPMGNTRAVSERRNSFIDRVLDGHARIDQFDDEVQAWLDGPGTRPLHEVLGLDADELDVVASTPGALRYVLYARRFDVTLSLDELRGAARVRSYATRLASSVMNPFDLADIETWAMQQHAASVSHERAVEPSHA